LQRCTSHAGQRREIGVVSGGHSSS
jgi:hypothetical protein